MSGRRHRSRSRLTRELRPDVATHNGVAGIDPARATVPAKPRKSRLGRLTHCTGKRNGLPRARVSTSTVSRCASSVGPRYQGVFGDGSMTLSPNRAEIGIATMAAEAELCGEVAVLVGDAFELVLRESRPGRSC